MRTYTFHHYGRGSIASGLSFASFGSDDEALREARRLLERDALRCVEVCDGPREVGAVSWDRVQGRAHVALGRACSA